MVERASINAQLRPSSRSNPPRLQPTPHSSSSSETSQRPPADRSRRLSAADRSHVLPGEVRHLRQAHVGGLRPPRRVRARADPRGPALRLPGLARRRPARREEGRRRRRGRCREDLRRRRGGGVCRFHGRRRCAVRRAWFPDEGWMMRQRVWPSCYQRRAVVLCAVISYGSQ